MSGGVCTLAGRARILYPAGVERLRSLLERIPAASAAGEAGGTPALAPALAWTLAAGPLLAAEAQCLGLHRGVLTLAVADASSQARIEGVLVELRRALEQMLGSGQVQKLHFVINPEGHAPVQQH